MNNMIKPLAASPHTVKDLFVISVSRPAGPVVIEGTFYFRLPR